MAFLVDANIIIDLVEGNSSWTHWAERQIIEARLEDALVFNVVIAAEVAHMFKSTERYRNLFDPNVWEFEDIPFDAGLRAGQAHRLYRERGGKREQTLPDFLIGAHADIAGHTLITRDAARYRTYFPSLTIIAPDTNP
jgi:predicted nucleic acid-binding protein